MASIHLSKSKVTAEGKAFKKAVGEIQAQGGLLKTGKPKSRRKAKETTPLFADHSQINLF